MNHTLIIAEAGVNHNGSIELAKKLIDAAAIAGVDYVKFQTFKAEKLVTKTAQKATYQQETTGTNGGQFEMLKKLELDEDTHHLLIDYCASKNIKFLSTGFDLDSLEMLNDLGIAIFKVPSGELTNLPYLRKIAGFGKPVILSTGMATMDEVGDALQVILDGGIEKKDITILHCNTQYPTPMHDVNLRAMNAIGEKYEIAYGYSDHTLGIEIPIAAVAMGATCIEKHFTLDNTMEGPDHRASLEPNQLLDMVRGIRNIEQALGSPIKTPSPSEIENIPLGRKSVYLLNSINKGEIIRESDLIILRPGNGISPMLLDTIIDKTATKDLVSGSQLKKNDYE